MKKRKTSIKAVEIKSKFVLLSIIIIGFILYGSSIQNDYNIDDNYVVEDNELVSDGIKAIPEIFTSRYHTQDDHYFGYRPLTIAVFAIEWDIFVNILGIKAAQFPHIAHFFNILYYILCVSILFLVMKKLLEGKKFAQTISFITCIVFLVHPIHTEVVLSLKNREEILMTIFSLLALYQSIRYYETKKTKRIIAASLLLTLAFLAKESAIVFLAIIPLSIIFFRTDFRIKLNTNIFRLNNGFFLALIINTLLFITTIGSFHLWGGISIDNPIRIADSLGIVSLILFLIFTLMYGLNINHIIKHQHKKIKSVLSNPLFIAGIIGLIAGAFLKNSSIGVITLIILDLHIFQQSKQIKKEITSEITKSSKNLIWLKPVIISIFSLGILILLITISQDQLLPENNAPVYKWQNPIFDFSKTTGEKAAIALYSLGYYLKMLVVPHPLRFYYGYKMIPDVTMANFLVLLSLFIHLGLLVYALLKFNKREIVAYAILFYLIAIAPFSNIFFALTGIVAERLLFVPSIAFSIAIATFTFVLVTKFTKPINSAKIPSFALIIILLISIPAAAHTIDRNKDWKNRTSLYEKDIQYLDNSAKVNNLYANYVIAEVYAYMKLNRNPAEMQDRINLAIKHYKQAIAVDSTYTNPIHNLGYIYLIIARDYTLAKSYFDQCLEVESTLDEAFLNRGIANFYLNEYNNCIEDMIEYQKLVKTDKNFEKVFYYLGRSYYALGDSINGRKYLLETLSVPHTSDAVIKDIQKFFADNDDYISAIAATNILIKRTPESDVNYVNKGNYFLLSNDTVSAIQNWEIAFEKFPGNYNIGITLSQYWLNVGNIEKSNYYYTKAIEYQQQKK